MYKNIRKEEEAGVVSQHDTMGAETILKILMKELTPKKTATKKEKALYASTVLMAFGMLFFSCGDKKDQQKIKELEQNISGWVKDSTNLEGQGRTALKQGSTDPDDIEKALFNRMNAVPSIPHETFADTGNYIQDIGYPYVIDQYKLFDLPAPNGKNMNTYFDILGKYFDVCDNLKEARSELSVLKK